MKLEPIGIIHTPYKQRKGMPIQPAGADGAKGIVEVFEKFKAGLKDVDGFSHIILIYEFHHSQGFELEVIPFMDTKSHGVFATRAPKRPNSIGISTVKIKRVEGCNIYVENVDILNGTPLLDIKPYVPEFDIYKDVCAGWLEKETNNVGSQRADDRFK